jgi:small subunit ribosomal protein S1
MSENNQQETTLTPTLDRITFEDAPMPEEELQQLYEGSLSKFSEGSVVIGTILSITRDEVMVDIGYKSEGVIRLWEFEDITQFSIGDKLEVFLETVEDQNGMVVLSKIKAEKQRRWEEILENYNEGDIIRGKVMRRVRGGLIVDVGIEAFLPASQVDIKHITNTDEYINRDYDFKILKISSERKNIVVSRRELLEEERQKNRESLLKEIEVGQVREGVVKNITDFGAFIDLFGMDGLLHITDMTWGRINHPGEILRIGDKINVMVLDFDQERQRISLGLKQTTPNPWDEIENKYPVGSIIKGKIVNLLPYGAFIEVEQGVEGLIHISELSWTKRISNPAEVLTIGEEVEAMVLSIKKDECKISLGIKQTEFNPWSVVEEKYPVDTRVKGKVRNVTSYGAFVELEEGIDGLIHISDISWTRKINHPAEMLKKGDEVEALILNVNPEEKKITLGLKQLQEDPWDKIEEQLAVGTIIDVEVTKVADFGVFVALESKIESLVHISQISEKSSEAAQGKYKPGDKFKVKVVKIDLGERKIVLSERELVQDERRVEQDKRRQERDKTQQAVKKRVNEEEERRASFPTEMERSFDAALKTTDDAPEAEASTEQEPASGPPAQPAAEEPVAKEAEVKEAVAKEPEVKEAVVKEAEVKEPEVKEPVVKEAVAEEPEAQPEPAADTTEAAPAEPVAEEQKPVEEPAPETASAEPVEEEKPAEEPVPEVPQSSEAEQTADDPEKEKPEGE